MMMTKQDIDGMRCGKKTASENSILMGRKCHTYASQMPYLAGINSMFMKAILLVLLFFAGGMGSEAWADDIHFIIVNNSGEQVIEYIDNNGTATVHAKVKSPFATNFRFYDSETAAVFDASNGSTAASATYSANVITAGAPVSSGPIYVRYDYTATPTSAYCVDTSGDYIKIDGSAYYNLAGDNASKYPSYNGKDINISWSTTAPTASAKAAMWKFKGANAGFNSNVPDPYDVEIINAAGEEDDDSYVLTGDWGSLTGTAPANQTSVTTKYYARNHSISGHTLLNKFFFVINDWQNTNKGAILLLVAKPCFVYDTTKSRADAGGWFMLNGNNSCIRKDYRAEESGQKSDFKFIARKPCHEYVIEANDGTDLVRGYPEISERTTLTVPATISSPHASYTYYTSEVDASAGTNSINVLPDLATYPTIYVRYTSDTEASIDLTGTNAYVIRLNGYYLYDNSGTLSTETAADRSLTSRQWLFVAGSNPYAVKIKNVATNSYLKCTLPASARGVIRRTAANGTVTMTATEGEASTFFVRSHGDGSYELVYVPTTSTDFSTGYYTLGVSSGSVSLFSSDNAPMGASVLQTTTFPASTTYTYKVLDESGTLVAQETRTHTTAEAAVIPDDIFSPMVTAYSYYHTEAEATAASYGASTSISNVQEDDDNVIYVRYTYDKTAFADNASYDGNSFFMLTYDNSRFFSMQISRYDTDFWAGYKDFTTDEENNTTKEELHRRWLLEGDPYQAKLRSVFWNTYGINRYMTNGGTNTSASDGTFMILSHEVSPSASDIYLSFRKNDGVYSTYTFWRNDGGNMRPNMTNKNYRTSRNDCKFRLTRNGFEVTWHILDGTDNNNEIFTTTTHEIEGFNAAMPGKTIRLGCNYGSLMSAASGGVEVTTYSSSTPDIYIIYTGIDQTKLPFHFSTSGNERYYTMYFTGEGRMVTKLAGVDGNIKNNGTRLTTAEEKTADGIAEKILSTGKQDEYLWTFWGNPYNIEIRSKADPTLSWRAQSSDYTRNWTSTQVPTSNTYANNNILTLSTGSELNKWGVRKPHNSSATNEITLSLKEQPDLFWWVIWNWNDGNADWQKMELNYAQFRNGNTNANIAVTEFIPPTRDYTFHIIDDSGREALQTTVNGLTAGNACDDYMPEVLKSPAVSSYSYFSTWAGDGNAPTGNISTLPLGTSPVDVYVRYTVNPSFSLGFDGSSYYNIKVNSQYAYSDGTDAKTAATVDAANSTNYVWQLRGDDPYALLLNTMGDNTKRLGATAFTDETATQFYASDDANVRRFALLGGDGTTDHYTLAAASGSSITDGNFAYLGRKDDGAVTLLLSGASYTQAAAQTQVLFEPLKTTFTYHIYDLAGNEAIQYTVTDVFDLTPSVPSAIASPYVSQWSYWSDDTRETSLAGNLANTDASGNVYVTYAAADITLPAILDLDGSRSYIIQSKGVDHYANANGSNVGTDTNKSNLTADTRKWLLTCVSGDPYNVVVTNKNTSTRITASTPATTGSLTLSAEGSRFILWPHETEGSFGLMLASGSSITDSQFSYIGETDNAIKLVATTDATSANRQLTFLMAPVVYTVIDLSGHAALKSQTEYPAIGSTASLPEAFRSPLVETYYYWSTHNVADGSPVVDDELSGGALPANGGDIYVTYTPYTLADAPLKLDGSINYGVFNKEVGMDGIMGPQSYNSNGQIFPYTDANQNYREKYYYLNLRGTQVGEYYDPYDLRIYSPGNNRYWSNTIKTTGTNENDQLSIYNEDTKYYMILNGASSQYVEIMSRKRDGNTYHSEIYNYQYVFYNGSRLNVGQNPSTYKHGNDNMQFHIQPAYTYHVITLEGKEAISAIGTKMEMSVDGTTQTKPAIPSLIESALVTTYHYYDITAFNVRDGIYTLKDGATKLEHLTDATTQDIYVVYDRSEISNAIDLTGQKSYNMMVHPTEKRYVYYSSSNNNSFLTTGDDTDIQQNNYLWQFTGGDPYALKLQNADKPGFVASNVDGQSNYQGNIGLVNPLRSISTYMLVKGYGSGEYDYRLMSSPAAQNDGGQSNTYFYQYIGGNRSNWPGGREATPAYFVAWVNAGDHGHYNYKTSDFIQLKLTPQNEATYKYVVVNDAGDALVSYTVNGTSGVTPLIPDPIKSPCASGFTYYDDSTGGNVVTSTVGDRTIYVHYTLNPENTLNLSGNTDYNFLVNGSYVYSGGSGLSSEATPADATATSHVWRLAGNDPYQLRIQSQDGSQLLTYDGSNSISLTAGTPAPFIILQGATTGKYELMAARGQDASTTYAHVGREDAATIIALFDQDTHQYYDAQIAVVFKKLPSPITWHILDRSGREAVKYTQKYGDDLPSLTFADIPAAIRSPYIENETLTFYTTVSAGAAAADGRTVYTPSGNITSIPSSGLTDIYVTYTNTALASKPLRLDGITSYDMNINNRYIYQSGSALTAITTLDEFTDRSYMWHLSGQDPYAVQIQNVETSDYFLHAESPAAQLSLGTAQAGSYFILMQYADWQTTDEQARVELMAATGADLSEQPYYSVGRGSSGSPRLYDSNTYSSYTHGSNFLKVLLHVSLRDIYYHIVDRAGVVIATIPYSTGAAASLPDDWRSPMATNYRYWQASAFTGSGTTADPYVLTDGAEQTTNEASYADRHVYVTYDVLTNTSSADYVDMNTAVTDYTTRVTRSSSDATQVRDASKFGTMYMLKFLNGTDDYLENGKDVRESELKTPVYPYTNGDGAIYVYDQTRWDDQAEAGASTRTRWPWYVLSPTNDPYHVLITSWQNSHANSGTNYYNFLRTYYNTTINQVVTTNISDDPRVTDTENLGGSADNVPTEYMLLGSKANGFKLRTTNEISDGTTSAHRTVDSFEQYWKNNPTVKELAGDNPAANNSTLTTMGWHRYQTWANAVPFAGGSRVFEYTNHWYKTIDMGELFDLVPTEIDAVLVLLDNHGWEIMRHNIAKHRETAKYEADKAALRVYDSPMVSQYRFYGYRNAPKDAGYHKYTIEANTLVGTGASLADYPEKYSGGALYDLYVLYDVKPEYAHGYTAAATEGGSSATAYLVQQGTNYAQAADASATTITRVDKSTINITSNTDVTDNLLWYLQRNFNIDHEMGYAYSDDANGTLTQAETEAAYMASDVFSNGLDPYNLQLKNKATGHYFKLQHVSTATAVGSQWTATYTGDDMSVGLSQTLDNTLGTGHDNTTVRMTNATFMAIDDGHGNIRLMPRFDHQHVQTDFASLAAQQAAAPAGDNGSSTQTTIFLLPNPYTYIIVDNQGHEAVRFQSAGDVGPQMKEQFQSPLAKNFKFYKTTTFNDDNIISTFAGVTLTDNKVYVRYDYDSDADVYGLLKAARATMQVGGTNDVQYDSNIIKSGTKDATAEEWQWQLAHDVTDTPDPYAVYVYNRSDLTKSMNVGTLGTDAVTANATGSRFVLLPFSGGTENDYALMVAGTQSEGSYQYYFLDGASISTGATTAQVTTYANSAALESKNKVHFNFDITPSTVTYKLITDGGKVALEATVTPSSPYKADMPDWMKTPLMTDDAYIYCTKATGNDAEGWNVNENSWTQTLLNLEAGNTVYVRYHYADSKTAVGHSANRASNKSVIDLSGTVPYYLQMHVWTWYDPSDSKVSLSQSEDAYYDANETARWLFKGNDPYAISFVNPSYSDTKILSSATPADGERVFATMQDLSAEGYPNQTFMILKGGTNYIYAYVTGSQNLRLTEKGTDGLQLYNDTKQYSAYENKNQIHDNQPYASFKFYPMVRYHVITNSNVEAINALSPLPATTVNLDAYKTPLLPSNAYSYYTEAPTMEAGVLTTHGTKIAEGTTLAEMARQLITDLYVRYAAYDRATSPLQYPDGVGSEKYQGLDLSGNTWYNMGRFMEHAITSDNPSYYPPGGDTSPNSWYDWSNVIYLNGNNMTTTALSGENGKSTTPGLSSKQMVWRFVGDDPYAIRIYNASQGNLPLTATNGSQNIKFAETGDCQTFMMLKGRGQDDRNIRWANDSKTEILDCNLFMLTGTTGRYLNVRDSKVDNYFFHYWTGQWSMNTNLGNGSGGTQGGWVYFYKAPTARRYHYFAVNQEKGEVTWDAILEHDWFADIELDNNISRLYTKYEEKHLGVAGKKANEFKTREELNDVAQFYSDASLTTRVSYVDAEAGTLYDVYPDFNDEEYPDGYPIYFKYQPMTNTEIAALTGDEKTDFRWTTAGQIAGDVTYYQKNGQLDKTHLTTDDHANWFFMVLDTDEGITATGTGADRKFTGNQYFLRREDTGSIGWLNSVRTLHHKNEDNLNGYSYSRLAESTRDSEHTPFREARWLWTFVGNDPYDVKLINFESALGIDAEYEDDKMEGAANCYTRFNTVTTTDAKTGVTTTTYPVSIPTSEPAAADHPYYQWGLTNGYGTENTFSLLSTYPTTTVDGLTENLQLYWQMTADSVSLQPRASLRENAMQLLPYKPTKYEDVNLVIRRDDEVATYTNTYSTPLASVGDKTAQLNYLNNTMKTGISRMFFAAEDRMFVAGDKITADNIPVEVKRQFCTYITYSDDYRNEGDATIGEGPYRFEHTGYNADNEPVYNYKYDITDEDETPVTQPQSFYVKYHVNSDIFLTEDVFDGKTEEQMKAEVARMANENDHVYFLDFTDNLSQEGYNLGYHAYFDEEGSMKSQLPKEWTDERRVERKVWSTTEGNYVDATGDIYTDENGVKIDPLYNQWQYQTTSNRMTSVPEKLKWYFVGDPYNVQVFCTKLPGYNLARFNEEESHFQFIADCVHLRASDNVNNIDNRENIPEYKAGLGEGGAPVATGKTMRNPNYNKPVYGSFYWEMVPAATTREGTFALRFRASNTVLGLEKVYYYLTHDGTQRSYYKASAGTAEKFNVNLNYDKNNTYSNAYEGLHKANNAQAAIHLVQPAKVYVTAYPKGTTTPKVIDELTEYFGVGETLSDVPRHLKRKYTTYSNLRYIPKGGKTLSSTSDYNGSGGTQEIFPLKLTTDVAYNYSNCNTEHPVGDTTTPNYDKVFVSGASTNADFRLWVDYELDSDGKRLFTTAENATAGDYTWNDLLVKDWQGDKESEPGRVATTWMYYDKTKYDAKTTAHSDLGQWRITSFNDASLSSSGNGWNTGVKGLHWAFVGDAYSFKMVNRRQLDNKGNTCYDESINCPYVGTSNVNETAFKAHSTMSAGGLYSYPVGGQRIEDTGFRAIPYSAYLRMQLSGTAGSGITTGNGNTDWGFVYCKTGGDDQVLLRTASLKTTIGDYSNEFTPANDYTNTPVDANLFTGTLNPGDAAADAYNHTNNFHYVEWQRGHYKETDTGGAGSVKPENNSDVVIADFLLTPFTLSTPTNYIDQMQPATANMPDGDPGLNDCFDADVFVRDINGTLKAQKQKAELRYTDSANGITVSDVLPQSLKRYGCSYRAYINYGTATQKEITEFSDATLAEATVTEAGTDCLKDITYIYTVDDEVAQFFTSADDARNDEYTWASGYYRWDRTITGRVQYYETESYISDYVYNAAGRVEGYIYSTREVPRWSDGSSTTVTSNGWLNTHNGSGQAFGDDHQQNDNDNDQKWAYVGDPYSFTLQNYTKYLQNPTSALYYNNSTGSVDFSLTQSSNWTLALDSNGKYYLALIDSDGNILSYSTFDRGDNTDLAVDQQFLYTNGGLPADDPTGNILGLNGKVKPFYLANLNSFAAFVIYHLVTAHQHAADYEDDNTSLDSDGRRKVRQLMAEYLKYHAKDKYDLYCEKSAKTFDYLDSLCIGDAKGYVLDDFKSTYIDANGKVTGDAQTYLTSENSVLHQASLRDVVSYPINNYIVTKVPLGNVLNVPWYMKRQFCKYTLRQRDVLRSATNYSDPITVIKDGVTCYVWMNDELGVADTLATSQSKGSPWYKVCNVNWESVTLYDGPNEDTQKDKVTIAAENGNIITKLNKTHQNRMVLVDVVYEVDPEQFKFAVKGRNTTRWYSMMTNNVQDGLMNFSYKAGIGARPDRTQHYTNNYLWAPEGDPYGFILHNRYATLNGSGWDNIVVSTTSRLPDAETVADKSLKAGEMEKVEFPANSERMTYAKAEALGETTITLSGSAAVDQAVYTGQKSLVQFNQRRITHPGRDETTGRRSWAPTNAVYEMFVGNYAQAFLMHPTSAYVNTSGDKFGSFYMVHKPQTATSQLEYSADVSMLRSAPDANWRLITTPEQLLPYFERSGYVGGLNTTVASRPQNRSYYSKLLEFQSAWTNDLSGLPSDYFTTTDKIRDLVYGGKFYARQSTGAYDTDEFTYDQPRPKGGDSYKLPLKFVPDNLIPMQKGYYRLVAFSQKGLDADADKIGGGIKGPRYISGYRHESEKNYEGYEGSGGTKTLTPGSRWLHFYETDETNTRYKTFSELNSAIGSLDQSFEDERAITPHPALRGNIEILPAEYDPSSIFYFTPVTGDGYDRYNFGTQGLRVRGRAGGVQSGVSTNHYSDISVDEKFGMTKLVDPGAAVETDFDDRFRLQDIGGAAVTLRLLKTEPTGSNWDEIVGDNLKNNSLCIDANHRYRVTIHTNNEMMEIGDTYDATAGHWTGLGIQDTKWLLQPVGTKTQWPYNEVPLRLEVQKGEQKSGTDSEGNDVYNYYASLYVPFDTRLSNTTDVAFTLDQAPKATGETEGSKGQQSVTLRSLALLNNMGNPQFIPGGWPVVIRSSSPKASTINSVNGKPETRHYVELYLPNVEPTSIPESKAKIDAAGLKGSYLERSLTATDVPGLTMSGEYPLSSTNTVMVFGQPFEEKTGDETTTAGAVTYYAHTDEAPGFCTNENWWRGHYGTTQVDATSNDGTLSTAFLANSHGTETATKQQRSNTYVYHNKVFLIYEASTSVAPRYMPTRFGGEDDNDEDDDRDIEEGVTNKAPWPCDVYDLQGRKVATNETPSTLLQNHPSLSKGVYIFGGRKVIVK